MNIEDVLSFFRGLDENIYAGLIVGCYYILVAWTKIRDGLGLSTKKDSNVSRLQKQHEFIKLKVDIELLKQTADLPSEKMDAILEEAERRYPDSQTREFTKLQKYVAIPTFLFFLFVAIMETIYPTDIEDALTPYDAVLGMVVITIFIVAAFWGLPKLNSTQSKGWLRTAYIAFWSIGFYLGSFMVVGGIDDPELNLLTEEYDGAIFVTSVLVSVILGLFDRLPFMPKPKPLETADESDLPHSTQSKSPTPLSENTKEPVSIA